MRRAGLTVDFTNLVITAQLVGDTVTFQVASGSLIDGYYTLGIIDPPAPEPSSLLLAELGMLVVVQRRQRK